MSAGLARGVAGPVRHMGVLRFAAVAAAALAGLSLVSPRPATASDCGSEPTEPSDLYEVLSPPAATVQASGAAPVDLSVHIKGGVLDFPSAFVNSVLEWGDGASVAVATSPCSGADDLDYSVWSDQVLTHRFAVPGTYQPRIVITVLGTTVPLPVVFLTVTPVEPTSAPTALPTSTPTPAPTAQPTVVGTSAAPTATAIPVTAVPAAGSAAPSPSQSPQPDSPTLSAASPTPAPSATPAPGRTASAAGPASSPSPPTGEVIMSLKGPDEVSTDPGVIATNLVLAGVTVWVLFSSVVLNQVLQGNRSEIDRRTARLTGFLKKARRGLGRRSGNASRLRTLGRLASAAGVLVLTGMVYSILEPGFGFNETTMVLFLSCVLGLGVVTYAYSGLESALTQRWVGVGAAVRPYPAAIAIALGSVAVSRVLNFQPGVIYGFVASCAVLGSGEADRRGEGRATAVPLAMLLVLSVVSWLLLSPMRDHWGNGNSWAEKVLEGSAVIVFVGGIEGLFIGMLPLEFFDGSKVFRWNRAVWLALAVVSAFLVWHVLLGRERAFFSGLRTASSVSVLILFIGYTVVSLGLWAYFWFKRPGRSAALEG